jgi:hypothetical protein
MKATGIQKLIRMLNKLYPKNKEYFPTISEERCLHEIEKIKKTIDYEQFIIVIDLLQQKITHSYGVQQWLGYENETFSLEKYISIIHPSRVDLLITFAEASIETANSKEQEVGFMEQKQILQLPLLHRKGHYISVKKCSYPFQIDKNGRIISHLNHFTIMNEKFDSSDSMKPEIKSEHIVNNITAETIIKKKTQQIIRKSKKFIGLNHIQLNILTQIANHPEKTQAVIFDELGINKNTRNTHTNRILGHAREYYHNDNLATLKELSLFLRREGVI